jgi:trk system potassium uptake protein
MSVLVLGCGRVGEGVARELTARDVEVVVVDHDPEALGRLGAGFPGRKVTGSILERDPLLDAGIAHADAVTVVTGSDAVNAVVALTARRRFRVPTVIARLYDPRFADINQRLGIRTLVPVSWGIQRIADLVTATTVASTVGLGTGGVEIVEARVPHLLDGRPVGELEVTGELHVVALTRHGRTSLTTPATRLAEGDLAHVAVGTAATGRLERLLGHAREEGS